VGGRGEKGERIYPQYLINLHYTDHLTWIL
jgi:hypothetical protein